MLTRDDRLVEEAVLELESREADGPLLEAPTGVLVPSSGSVIREDGTVKVAIIRPCISRGRRIRGLPPIYTPQMLAENAHVFTSWHMFMDHITEGMVEAVRRRNRSIRELGGRIVKSWYDPELTTEEDEARGYEKGGVVGLALPQPPIRAMLEADPEILRCSINAWPTGAREGTHRGKQGMLIEGISTEPPGSVDWVLRAGAGGRVLQEDEAFAVSLLEGFYDSRHLEGDPTVKPDFSKMTDDEIKEWLQENQPDVLARLTGESPVVITTPPPVTESYITADDADALLTEQESRLDATLAQRLQEHQEEVERRAEERISRTLRQHSLRDLAHELIEGAEGLTAGWKARLLESYAVLPTGPTAPLLLEDEKDGKDAETLLREDVEARVQEAITLISEARGVPAVLNQGKPRDPAETPKARPPETNSFREYMSETLNLKTPEDQDNALREAVTV